MTDNFHEPYVYILKSENFIVALYTFSLYATKNIFQTIWWKKLIVTKWQYVKVKVWDYLLNIITFTIKVIKLLMQQ